MNKHITKKNSFTFENKLYFYLINDNDIRFTEKRGVEMATAIMLLFNSADEHIDSFSVYDEKFKVLYATPSSAKKWYEEYLQRK